MLLIGQKLQLRNQSMDGCERAYYCIANSKKISSSGVH
jgi:hypothetical protein